MAFDKEKFDNDPKSEEFLDAFEYALEKIVERRKKLQKDEKEKEKSKGSIFDFFPGL